MQGRGCDNKRLGAPLILVCGCYAKRGMTILDDLADFLLDLGFNTKTCHQLFPLDPSASPEEKQRASMSALEQSSAVLFVALSATTLEIRPERDRFGGWGVERGVLLAWQEEGKALIPMGLLYDGPEEVKNASSMLRGSTGWVLEAVTEHVGSIYELRALAHHLCSQLLEMVRRPSAP